MSGVLDVPRVAVVFGGPSTEHEVSLASAQSAIAEMHSLGWDVLSAGVGRDGRWCIGPDALARLVEEADGGRLPLSLAPADRKAIDFEIFDGPPPTEVFKNHPVAFPLCHGQWGEDGTLQGLLLSYGLRVVGVGVASSALCFDKRLSKAVLTAAGVPVTRGHHVTADDWAIDADSVVNEVFRRLGTGSWFVKPNRGGSSIGAIGPVERPDLAAAIDEALRFDDEALVEEFIQHRELMVGVMRADSLHVSPPLESITVNGVLDFAAKYQRSSVEFPSPTDLSTEQRAEIRRTAVAAVRALGCENLCRVDFFLDIPTGRLLVNEVNTVPGLTKHSAFSQLMGTLGSSYAATLTALYRAAETQRHPSGGVRRAR